MDVSRNLSTLADLELSILLTRDELAIRPATISDFPFLFAALNDEAVYRYWGGEPIEAAYVLQHSQVLEEDDECVYPFIIAVNKLPAGFLQLCVTSECAGIDLFLMTEFRGKGYGTRIIRTISEELMTKVPTLTVTADPVITNDVSISAFLKAGFRETGELRDQEEGRCVIMEYEPKERSAR